MSFNGSGTFQINTAGQPVVSGTVISSTAFNALTADLATGLSTCITKDGQTTVTANLPMSTFKFTGLGAGSAATDSANLSQVQSTVVKLLGSVSGADTITAVGSPVVAAYAAGQMFYFVAAGTNTTTVTLNIDGLGAKAVTRDGATALAAGDIQSGEVCVVVYDGTRFQLINAANSFGNTTINGTLTVTGNTNLQANVSITSALNVGGVATFTSNPVLSGGTANGVLYLNGSKAATSGTALVFDGSNLGIGGSPGYRLDVTGGTSSFAPLNSVGAIRAQNNSTTALELHIRPASGKNGFISFTEDTVADRWVMGILGGNAGLLWGTGNPGSYTEQMRLTSTGLGIGTSSPGVKLDVAGAIRSIVSGGTPIVYLNNGSTQHSIQNESGAFTFYNSGVLRATLDSSGNLGLGVTPSAANVKTFEIGNVGNTLNGIGGGDIALMSNAYYNSGFKYAGSNLAASYRLQDGIHKWNIAASGTAGNAITFTQAMTLDASGNLGVGITSAGCRFNATQAASAALGAQIALHNNASTAVGNAVEIALLTDGGASPSGIRNGRIRVVNENAGNGAANMQFWTWSGSTDAERARITSGGAFLVGATSDEGGEKFNVTGNSESTYLSRFTHSGNNANRFGILIKCGANDASGTNYAAAFDDGDGTRQGQITFSGGTTTYGTSSDYRLKENIQPIDNALGRLAQLKPVKWNWKRNGLESEGFVAHELQEVVPIAVAGEKDAVDKDGNPMYQSVGAANIVPLLTKALQEAMTRIEQLEAKVAALESK